MSEQPFDDSTYLPFRSFRGQHENILGKIVYDDAMVFDRLGVSKVSSSIVQQCTTTLFSNEASSIQIIKECSALALEEETEELEEEEMDHWRDDQYSKNPLTCNYGSEQERIMYKPLHRILNRIAQFGVDNPRQIDLTRNLQIPDEAHTLGLRVSGPDFTICANGTNPTTSKFWRQRAAFGEIKPSKHQGPKPEYFDGPTPPIVWQCSDYACMLMAGRPFLLFCVGFLVFGTKFCVGIFDRVGVTFSPIHDIFDDVDC